jgi:DNA-binding MurR/RpiR family transcriptional regulator
MEIPENMNDALNRLKAYSESLSAAEKKVANYIENNYGKVIKMSLSEVAVNSGVSDATVVRFFKVLGYKRWVEFIVSLSRSLPMTSDLIYESIHPGDTSGLITKKVLSGAIQSIQATMEILDHEAIEKCIDFIDNAKTTLIVAVGNSAPMAEELFNQLFRIGINCLVITDAYLQIMRSALLTKDDTICVISQSGSSQIPIHAASIAREKGCKVIALTGDLTSPLAQLSDCVLVTVAQELKADAINSRIAQSSIIYAIYVNLALRHIERSISNEREIWGAVTKTDGL